MRSHVGLVLILAGALLVAAGLLVETGLLAWFGRLPGDIHIERDNLRIYVPLTSMLLTSIVVSLIWALVRWLR
jgi:membrane protein implicated in regulation of membrane protease activity